jgi:aspartate/methionine/tyrosine aminotransferase
VRFEAFDLERFQSTWENQVEINISESGIRPMSVEQLLGLAFPGGRVKSGTAFIRRLLTQKLGYSQTNGTVLLRKNIARLYPGATEDNVEVTNGGSEANFITMWRLVAPGDEVVVMLPNYMQVWGLGRALGAKVKPWWLRQSGASVQTEWAPNVGELNELVTKKTKVIAICNPNNPTGAVLSRDAMNAAVELARWAGAWIVADEVYQGAELEGAITPSFWTTGGGRKTPYEKLIVTNSLSKAYGLPGLRIGWLVGAKKAIQESWAAHDYTTIGPGALNDALAAVALSPKTRRAILARNRRILQTQWPVLESWVKQKENLFAVTPPRAGAIALLRYYFKMNSTTFADRVRQEKSVLLVPGDHFEMDGYIRIGFAGQASHLKKGLKRLGEMVEGFN